MLMLVDSDFDEEDIQDLEECLKKKWKKPIKKRKKESVDSEEILQSHNNSDSVMETSLDSNESLDMNLNKTRKKRSVSPAQCLDEIKKLKKCKKLNSRLERLIKIKNRRNKIPNDPQLSPLFKEKEMKWEDFVILECESKDEDSGIDSPSCSSVESTSCCTDTYTDCSNVKATQYSTCDNCLSHSTEVQEKVCTLCKDSCVACDHSENSICDNISNHNNDSDIWEIPEPNRIIAMDCEFVGLMPKNTSALGRCSIIDYDGNVLYDQYVKPVSQIMTYRTKWSGIRKRHMKKAIPFDIAQNQIRELIQDKIVVGHALYNDFNVMKISHPGKLRRDTSMFKPLRALANLPERVNPSLKNLSLGILGRTIQQSEHCSIEDCLASLDLYKEVRMDWEHKLIEKERRQLAHQNDIFDKIPGEKVLDMLETQSHEKGDANVDESCSTKTYLSDEFWPQYLFPNSNE